ncbi:MAG: hypothetical protein MJZ77_00355 [Bacteroidales bacterium]|nr:hypothetical protein [Bacteroidales bacterium]
MNTQKIIRYTPPALKTVSFAVEMGFFDSVTTESLTDGTTYGRESFAPTTNGSFESLGDGSTYGNSLFSDDTD